MKKLFNRSIIRRIFFLLIVICGFVWITKNSVGPKHIVLDSGGYSPRLLIVAKGTDVTFRAQTGKYFWPASDPHPIHTEDSRFDSGKALEPLSKWNFRFDTVGLWRYHDHLAPQFKGIVVVVGWDIKNLPMFFSRVMNYARTWTTSSETYYHQCGGLNKDCWDRVLIDVVRVKGVNAALRLVETLRKEHVDFANYCHQYADFIGEQAYWKIPAVERISAFDPGLVGQCNSGYLHGYMGEYISHATPQQGIAFCDRITSLYPTDFTVSFECYRGVGNGLTFRHGLSYWNDAKTIVDKALEGCTSVREPRACVQGVFGGIDHMYFGIHGFALQMDQDNPFSVCSVGDPDHEKICYEELVSSFFALIEYDKNRALPHLARLPYGHAESVIERLARIPFEMSPFGPEEYEDMIEWCRRAPSGLSRACFNGFVDKLVTIDVSYNESSNLARDFCQLAILSLSEKEACLMRLHDEKN